MRVLVVDDEAPARNRLSRMLRAIEGVEVVGEAHDGIEARDQIARLAPELVMLDIYMPGLDGLSLADSHTMPAVVFVTAHAEHAVRAFELAAVDYLLKPVTQARLALAIERAHNGLQRPDGPSMTTVISAARDAAIAPRIAARDGDRLRLFALDEVTRLHAADKYVVLHANGREYLLERSLSDLERDLAPLGWLRVHRAELVNLGAIRTLEMIDGARHITLCDGQCARVSRRNLAELRHALEQRRRRG